MNALRRATVGLTALLLILTGCRDGAERSAIAQTADPGVESDAGSSQSSLVVRRVWVGDDPNFYASDPSPDGRLLTEIDWSTGDLAVRDLETGELRHVTNKGSWLDSDNFAERSVFSRDGRRIAYAWYNEEIRAYELRAIGVDGSGERVLLSQGQNISYVWPNHWSPDGKQVLTTIFRPDRSNQLALVPAEGGSARALKTFDWRYAVEAEFSPDGRYIAYDFPPDEKSEARDIYALTADGSRETKLVEGPANDMLLGWVPGGDAILFYSDRSGTPGIWKLAVSEGRQAGEPRLVRGDVWRLSPLGFSRDAYFYGVTLEQPQVHTADIDLATGNLLSPPKPVAAPTAGFTRSGEWSPDGEKLAYLSGTPGTQTAYVVIRSTAGDEVRQIRLDFGTFWSLAWSPDGEWIILSGRGEKGQRGLWRLDLRQGKISLLVAAAPFEGGLNAFAIAPDGKTLYHPRVMGSEGGTIVARDLATGEERVIGSVLTGFGYRFSLSPDGRTLAFVEYDRSAQLDRLKLLPVGGGEAREIYTTPSASGITSRGGLVWTADGTHLLFVRSQSDELNLPQSLWKIPVAGGEPRKLFEMDVAMLRVRLHPDGRRLAFNSGSYKGEVWVLENLAELAAAGAGGSR